MRTTARLAAPVLLSLAITSAAHADPPAPTPAAGGTSEITFVNLVRGVPVVSVGSRTSRTDPGAVLLPSLAAGASASATLRGGLVQLSLRAANAPLTAAPLGAPQPWIVPSGQRVMIVFDGQGGLARFLNIDLTNSPAPAAGSGLMRFANLVANSNEDANAVDLCVAGATRAATPTVLWANTAFGTTAATPALPPGTAVDRAPVTLGAAQTWQLRQWAAPSCSGALIASGRVTLAASMPAVVAIAQGSVQGSDPVTMALCPEGPGACQIVTLRRSRR